MDERVEIIYEDKLLRIERIESFGHTGPDGFWYCQDEDEWVQVTRGSAVLGLNDGKQIALDCGDSYLIPARLPHRVAYTSTDCKWLCVFARTK